MTGAKILVYNEKNVLAKVRMMDEGYVSEEICRTCGGVCCKAKGCSLSPEDMLRELARRAGEERELRNGAEQDSGDGRDRLPDISELESWLQESQCAIDHFSGQTGPYYYIRMGHKCFTFIGVDAMGECIALTEKGCGLPYERRPKGGRYLEGRQDRHCQQHYTREQMEEDWKPYQALLKEIWDRWYLRLEDEGVFERCEEEYMQWQRKTRQMTGETR